MRKGGKREVATYEVDSKSDRQLLPSLQPRTLLSSIHELKINRLASGLSTLYQPRKSSISRHRLSLTKHLRLSLSCLLIEPNRPRQRQPRRRER